MRLTPDQRRKVIVTAATRIATEKGIAAVTHGAVAKRCSVPTSEKTVRHYFGNRDVLWSALRMENPGKFPKEEWE